MSRERVPLLHGGGGSGGDGGAEGAEARQAAEDQAAIQREEMEAREYRRLHPRRRAFPGSWSFTQLTNENGQIAGWRVEIDGEIAGMLVVRGADMVAIATAIEGSRDSPSPHDIMAAFVELGPGGSR